MSSSATWSSADEAVASVSSSGLASGLKPGSSSIRASVDGVTGSATLTVKPALAFGCCVNAIATGPDGTTYVGGTFTSVAAATGGWVPLDATTGRTTGTFARVNGAVYASAPDGAGGWFVGGSFTAVEGVPRRHLAHVKADGSVDQAWNPEPNDYVYALAVSGDTLYVGGQFTTIGSTTPGSFQPARSYVAALKTSDGTATYWNPDADGAVNALVVNGSRVYVGGRFHSIGAVSSGPHPTRNHLAALEASDGAATAWDPNPNGEVYALAVKVSDDSTVTVYAGGYFTAVGATPRNYLAAVRGSDGSATGWDPNPDNTIYALAVGGEVVYAGGYFGTIGRQSRSSLAALDVSTGDATGWDPSPDGTVNAVVVSGEKVYVGGSFSSIGGQPRPYLAAIDAGAATASDWDPRPNGQVYALGVSGSTVFAGGDLSGVAAERRSYLAAVDSSGELTAWNPGPNDVVKALVPSGDLVYAGGDFTRIGAVEDGATQPTRTYLAAVQASDGKATSWDPAPNSGVWRLAVSGDTVYVSGTFNRVGAVEGGATQPTRSYLAALQTSDGKATSWDPNPSGPSEALLVNGNTVYVGGYFSQIGAVAEGSSQPMRNYLAALDASDGTATAWDPHPNAPVLALALSGSTMYAGGYFSQIGAVATGSTPPARLYLAALDASDGTAATWDPRPSAPVFAIAATGTAVIAGGVFSNIGAVEAGAPQPSRRFLAALDPATGTTLAWDPGANSQVSALEVSGDTLRVGGYFLGVGSHGYGSFAALEAPVPEELAALLRY